MQSRDINQICHTYSEDIWVHILRVGVVYPIYLICGYITYTMHCLMTICIGTRSAGDLPTVLPLAGYGAQVPLVQAKELLHSQENFPHCELSNYASRRSRTRDTVKPSVCVCVYSSRNCSTVAIRQKLIASIGF